jgi:hypothetical protein
MTDQDLMDQAPAISVVYFDGLGAFRKINGVLRCVGYTIELGAQMNVLISLAGAEHAIRAMRFALDGEPTKTTIVGPRKSLPVLPR